MIGVGEGGADITPPERARFHEVRPQRLAPVRDGVDLLVLEQDFRLLLHIGLEVAGEAGVDLDPRQRRGEYVERYFIALVGVERVDDVVDLLRIVLEVLRRVEPGLEIGDDGVGLLCTNSGVAAMNTGIGSTPEKSIRSLPMPSATAMTLYGSTLTMASTVLAASAATMLFTSMRTSW